MSVFGSSAWESVAAASSPAESRPGFGSVSVIVPTYKEVENLPHLIERLGRLRDQTGMDLELLIMDDNSRDGSVELVESKGLPWARIVVRTKDRGLSPAVIDGMKLARGETLIIMDADLSHPPERIPELVEAVNAFGGRTGGVLADLAIGSRYVAGASTDENWGLFRWLNSKVATLLARPLTSAKDPMSGFIAIRRSTLQRAEDLNPVGYKIGLELIVKCGCRRVTEVPIHFADRKFGESKLNLQEQLKYLEHVRRLILHKFPNLSYVFRFSAVGASGVVVNLAVLTLLMTMGVPLNAAVATAILVSMVTNFTLNRQFTFAYARHRSIVGQFLGFMATCSVGALVNYWVTLAVARMPELGERIAPQAAALIGVTAGMTFNFVINRYLVFRKSRARE
jgi:dolichol-phosphate mannosyltransferase